MRRAARPAGPCACARVPSFEALQATRQRESTATLDEMYGLRAGIEGTLARGIRRCRLRRTR